MKKILVIDYDQSSLTSLQGILAKEGYQVVTAADGQAGWDKYNKESPDLVLLEAMLPKVHGFELCQRITSERNSQATVFIMTGVYKDRVYRTEALRTYGASEYFEKPLKMAELLASIEAVLGKPQPMPEVASVERSPIAPEPVFAKPVREVKAEPVPIESHRREKPKSDDDMFSLPPDLDQLSRDIPKIRKPAPARHEPAKDATFESLADELLKTVVIESAPPKTVDARPAGGNGNGREGGDIDQFIKSALAGFDLDKEKVKVPKTAPLPPPPPEEKPKPAPTPPPTVAFKPKPTPPAPETSVEKPKPTPPPLPDAAFSAPAKPAPRSTLTAGDPGSDTSPFFSPEKPKPGVPTEKPSVQAAPAPLAASIPAPKVFRPAGPVERKVPQASEPHPQPEPVRHEPKAREAEAIASADLFRDVSEAKAKKGLSPLVTVAAGVTVVAALGFFILRPKHAAPVDEGRNVPQTVAQASVPVKTAEEVPPPAEVKPAPAKTKAELKRKQEEPAPAGIETIIPPAAPSFEPPSIGSRASRGPGAAAVNPVQADTPSVKTEEAGAPVKPEESPSQGTATDAGSGADPGPEAAAPAPTPAAPPVNEGDLLDLGSVNEPPKLLKSVDPIYPQTAMRLGLEGAITINALIDEKGNVIDTGILKGIQDDKGLGRAAENAVKKWKFEPARKNGVAVKVWRSFVINFRADRSPADMRE